MPFFMVQHNITDSEFYAKNVAEMIKGAMGMGPMGPAFFLNLFACCKPP